MAIRRYTDDGAAFEPEGIKALSTAFDEVCKALQLGAGDSRNREVIAVRIIELARNGIIDPNALRNRVIAEARLNV